MRMRVIKIKGHPLEVLVLSGRTQFDKNGLLKYETTPERHVEATLKINSDWASGFMREKFAEAGYPHLGDRFGFWRGIPIERASASQHPNDKPNLKIGRHVALTKLAESVKGKVPDDVVNQILEARPKVVPA